jgi:hypothetical protein
MLTLDIVSKSPQLNAFTLHNNFQFASGEDIKVTMRLFQPDLRIRYIPSAAAVITIDLKKSDGTVLTKTCAFTFADDRSIIDFSLSAAESSVVISQNLVVKIVDGSVTTLAVLQYGLTRSITDGSC